MISHWSLSDSKSPQVSRTPLSILANLNNSIFWMISTRLFISKPSRPSVTVLRALITIGIIVTIMFSSFFNPLSRSKYLSFFSLSLNFSLSSAGTAKSTILYVVLIFISFIYLFIFVIIISGRLAKIRWSVCISISQESFCVLLSKTDAGLCIYYLFVW